MKQYRHLFFDLDRTLWDLDKNAHDTIKEIYLKHQLPEKGIIHFDDFLTTYTRFNNMLWDAYRKGEVIKEVLNVERFRLTLQNYNVHNDLLPQMLASDYVEISPTKTQLYPNALDTLEYLSKSYKMHIITNGFLETQYRKLSFSKLDKYFDKIIVSEEAGHMKPDKRIFEYALKMANATKEECIMIGDDPIVDVLAAKAFGIDQVYVNFENEEISEPPTFEIHNLIELKTIFTY
ncbi:MAG: YjjG family noncanonical pyrimidine nucleotidase [Bacteroidota bacterium]